VDVKAEQAKDSQAVVKEIENLKKKENYLEQTLKNSQDHMDAIFKRGG
jgi:prefoldin subunit 1